MLDGCGLSDMPPELGRLAGLAKLWLSNNGLRSLPPELGGMRGLNVLRLGSV